jgi:tetratricopeptide (TPR) repeat protein
MQTAPPDKIIPRDYEYLGKLMLKTKGDTLVALGHIKKSIELDSNSWGLWKDIAKTYYTKRMNCEASQAFQMYYDSVPAPEPVEAQDLYVWGLAQYYCKDDSLRYEHAEATFKKVTELMPKAGIGWLWAAKSARVKDPTPEDIEADPTKASTFGYAREYYEKYVEIAAADPVKNKKDLLAAYQYLAYVYLVKNESDKFYPTVEKWLALETDPEQQKYIMEMKESFGKDVPVTPSAPPKTTTPVPDNGGGGGKSGSRN